MRCSNSLVCILNLVTLLLSVPILGGAIWLRHHTTTTNNCTHFISTPTLILAILLLLVSVSGLLGSCCRLNFLLWIYLLAMFILIVVLFCFTIFAFVVTNEGAGRAVSGRGYKEYRVGDYSNWLQKRVGSDKNWSKIRSCLVDGNLCRKLMVEGNNGTVTDVNHFFAKHLSPTQSGCCKPPDSCNFGYVSPTNWTKSGTSTNPDCNAWSNDPNILCYNCQSCKAGVIQNIKSDWKKVAVINIIFLVFLIIVYSIGCCAFRNNRWDNSHNWKPYG